MWLQLGGKPELLLCELKCRTENGLTNLLGKASFFPQAQSHTIKELKLLIINWVWQHARFSKQFTILMAPKQSAVPYCRCVCFCGRPLEETVTLQGQVFRSAHCFDKKEDKSVGQTNLSASVSSQIKRRNELARGGRVNLLFLHTKVAESKHVGFWAVWDACNVLQSGSLWKAPLYNSPISSRVKQLKYVNS